MDDRAAGGLGAAARDAEELREIAPVVREGGGADEEAARQEAGAFLGEPRQDAAAARVGGEPVGLGQEQAELALVDAGEHVDVARAKEDLLGHLRRAQG